MEKSLTYAEDDFYSDDSNLEESNESSPLRNQYDDDEDEEYVYDNEFDENSHGSEKEKMDKDETYSQQENDYDYEDDFEASLRSSHHIQEDDDPDYQEDFTTNSDLIHKYSIDENSYYFTENVQHTSNNEFENQHIAEDYGFHGEEEGMEEDGVNYFFESPRAQPPSPSFISSPLQNQFFPQDQDKSATEDPFLSIPSPPKGHKLPSSQGPSKTSKLSNQNSNHKGKKRDVSPGPSSYKPKPTPPVSFPYRQKKDSRDQDQGGGGGRVGGGGNGKGRKGKRSPGDISEDSESMGTDEILALLGDPPPSLQSQTTNTVNNKKPHPPPHPPSHPHPHPPSHSHPTHINISPSPNNEHSPAPSPADPDPNLPFSLHSGPRAALMRVREKRSLPPRLVAAVKPVGSVVSSQMQPSTFELQRQIDSLTRQLHKLTTENTQLIEIVHDDGVAQRIQDARAAVMEKETRIQQLMQDNRSLARIARDQARILIERDLKQEKDQSNLLAPEGQVRVLLERSRKLSSQLAESRSNERELRGELEGRKKKERKLKGNLSYLKSVLREKEEQILDLRTRFLSHSNSEGSEGRPTSTPADSNLDPSSLPSLTGFIGVKEDFSPPEPLKEKLKEKEKEKEKEKDEGKIELEERLVDRLRTSLASQKAGFEKEAERIKGDLKQAEEKVGILEKELDQREKEKKNQLITVTKLRKSYEALFEACQKLHLSARLREATAQAPYSPRITSSHARRTPIALMHPPPIQSIQKTGILQDGEEEEEDESSNLQEEGFEPGNETGGNFTFLTTEIG